MSISVNNYNTPGSYQTGVASTASQKGDNVQEENKNAAVPKDAVSLSGQTTESAKNAKKIYGKPANPEAVARMKQEAEESYNQLKLLVQELILKQGGKFSDIFNGKIKLKANAETIKKAQEDIAEDGYWGVEKTAERITGFAKALIGDDLEKLPMIRDAVKNGFEEAEKIWGGTLPEICYRTYDRIMAEFDSWEKAGNIPPMKE